MQPTGLRPRLMPTLGRRAAVATVPSCREVDALVRIAEIAMAGFVMAALLVSASPGEAQQARRLPQVGLLVYGSPRPAASPEEAILGGLKELGWVEGQNMALLI